MNILDIAAKFPWLRSVWIIKKLIKDVEFDRAERAVKLGYAICRSHEAPIVMRETEKRQVFKCPICGKEEYTGAVSVGREPESRHRLFPRNPPR
jgi:predicted RNA-binding Zn-ribbon protein involved in translation (DUF1610 family)